jgi:hypothetical protein
LVADLPCAGRHVQLVLHVRKFRRDTPTCPRKVFAERLGPFVEVWARTTTRFRKAIEAIGLATCGEGGARLADRLGIWEPNHARVSDFLDTLTYHHALCGGALHGGSAWTFQREEPQRAWLEQYWQRKIIAPMVIGEVDDFAEDLPFYVRPGQALFCGGICAAATSSVEALDELGQVFQFIESLILHVNPRMLRKKLVEICGTFPCRPLIFRPCVGHSRPG